jgi:hypothetical protein
MSIGRRGSSLTHIFAKEPDHIERVPAGHQHQRLPFGLIGADHLWFVCAAVLSISTRLTTGGILSTMLSFR